MPNIQEYDAGPLQIRPSETGVESTARAAQREGAYGNQIAGAYERAGQAIGSAVRTVGDQAVQYMAHREVSAGSAHGAELIAALNEDWNQTAKNADPNDQTVAAKWREEKLEPALDQFSQGFTTEGGQQWAQHFVDQYREHATIKTAADMSSLAGEAVHVNTVKTINSLAAATFNDPSTLTFAKDALSHSVDGLVGSSPNITAADAARVKTELTETGQEQLVKAAIQGAISKGGNWQKIANDPANAPYVKPAENLQFQRQEDFYKRGAAVAQKQEVLLNKQIAEQNAHASIADSWSKNVKVDDQTGHVTIDPQFVKDMVNLPQRNPNAPDAVDKAKTYIDWAEAQQNKNMAVRDDPNATASLLQSFSDPNMTSDNANMAIAKAEIAKTVTPQTAAQMRTLVGSMNDLKDPVLSKVLEGAKSQIEQKYSGVTLNPGAYEAFYYKFLHNTYLPLKRAGTLPPNALDIGDPKSLIAQSIAAARPSLADTTAANGGVGAPPLPTYTAPAGKPPAGPAAALVNSKADYDKLPAGAVFTHNGKQFVKPGEALAPGQM